MAKSRFVLGAVGATAAVLAVAFWWVSRGGSRPPAVDLVAQFGAADKRSTLAATEAFAVKDLTIEGDTRHSIYAHPTSRITWKVTVPDDGWLKTAIGLDPAAWDKEGDGVLFRIGISDGRTYEELLTQDVNPASATGDRRWIPVEIDLSPYSGRQVDIIFNTNASLPKQGNDDRNDLAYWGSPAVFAGR